MKIKTDEIMDSGWNFDNTYINLPSKFYSVQDPVPAMSPSHIILIKVWQGT